MEKIAYYKIKYGTLLVGYEDGAITRLNCTRENEVFIDGEPCPLTDMAFSQLQEYFQGERKQFSLPLNPKGTNFQKKVWKALCSIPYGATRTYKEIALEVGNERASRAVGMANHNNPIWIMIPCHRVVGINGKLIGYAGGLDLKEELLRLERSKK